MNQFLKFKERIASRKFVLMFSILLLSTLLMLLPTFLNFVAGLSLASLITGGEFVSLILGSYGIYVSGNVIQKKKQEIEDPAD